ncbi:hemolysin family protein [Actinospongicola halichondriae]|uniref:hemolysin family protein n=1 Tax=Actinospongicola halichondriae TaxID=3236844 RepID=UPI003D4B8851
MALIVANGAFVAHEFALVAVDRSRIKRQAEDGVARARAVERQIRRLSFHLSGAQLGITVTSLVLGFIAEPVVARLLEPLVGSLVGDDRAVAVSVVLALLLATTLQMVMGELVPKSVAIAEPTQSAFALARPMQAYGFVVGPMVRFLNGVANWTVRRLGIEPQEELRSVRNLNELDFLFRSSSEEGMIDEESLTLLTRAVRFSHKTAADALVPRTEVIGLPSDGTVADLTALATATGFSRFPVYDGDLDQIEGVGHVKDAFTVPFRDRPETSIATVTVDALVVPETLGLSSLLALLRERATHLAVVVDEYGGTAGIITLEDVLEEVVGEIDDEHDRAVPPLTRVQRPGEWVVGGGQHPDEVFDTCGFEIPEGPYETIAGFVLDTFGRIPEAGDHFDHAGWRVEVLEMDRLRVSTVRLVAPDEVAQ